MAKSAYLKVRNPRLFHGSLLTIRPVSYFQKIVRFDQKLTCWTIPVDGVTVLVMVELLGMELLGVLVVVVTGVGCVLAFITALCKAGPKYPYSCLYSSKLSGGFRIFFTTGAKTLISNCFTCPEEALSIFEGLLPSK